MKCLQTGLLASAIALSSPAISQEEGTERILPSAEQCRNVIKNIVGRLLVDGNGQPVIIIPRDIDNHVLSKMNLSECKTHMPYGEENFGARFIEKDSELHIKYTQDIPNQYKSQKDF